MSMLRTLKDRFPRAYPALTLALGLAAVGGVAAYEKRAEDACCHPGAACCHPGAACCASHQQHAAR